MEGGCLAAPKKIVSGTRAGSEGKVCVCVGGGGGGSLRVCVCVCGGGDLAAPGGVRLWIAGKQGGGRDLGGSFLRGRLRVCVRAWRGGEGPRGARRGTSRGAAAPAPPRRTPAAPPAPPRRLNTAATLGCDDKRNPPRRWDNPSPISPPPTDGMRLRNRMNLVFYPCESQQCGCEIASTLKRYFLSGGWAGTHFLSRRDAPKRAPAPAAVHVRGV